METTTLPQVLTGVFSIGGVLLFVGLIWSVSRYMTPADQRPDYKHKKVVENYLDKKEGEKQIDGTSVSAKLANHWRAGLRDFDLD